MPSKFWNPERVELVTRMRAEGATATEIALEIGGNCTRNSVLGKCHRLKLLPPMASIVRAKRRRAAVAGRPITVATKAASPPPPPDDTRPGVSLLDLEHDSCRQVIRYGDDHLALYCGDKVQEGSWCCVGHHAINYYTYSPSRNARPFIHRRGSGR